jgi:hypothetical protein
MLWGAPLVVFNTASEEDQQEEEEADQEQQLLQYQSLLRPRKVARRCRAASPLQEELELQSWTVLPVPGQHVAFRGNLLHGVPSELSPFLVLTDSDSDSDRDRDDSQYRRMSLPVNVWSSSKKPSGAQVLPQAFIDSLLLLRCEGRGKDKGSSSSKNKQQQHQQQQQQQQQQQPLAVLAVSSATRLPFAELTGAAEPEPDSSSSSSSSKSDWLTLSQHRPGDTAPLPLSAIRHTLKRARAAAVPAAVPAAVSAAELEWEAGVHVIYDSPPHPHIVVRPPTRWVGHNI